MQKHIQNIKIFSLVVIFGLLNACTNDANKASKSKPADSTLQDSCGDSCVGDGDSGELYCKLTSKEFKERKETLLKSMHRQVLERKELSNGYAFKFKGTDSMVDVLAGFIKTERHCCDFFTFYLTVKGDSTSAWLQITGPKEAKVFIKDELDL